MPALAFLAVAGLVLTALLFVADAKLKNSSSPAIVTSQRTGLPEPQYHNATRTLTNTPAPAPDMTSQAVLAAQPKSELEHQATIPDEARAARAEAPPKKARVEASAKKARAEAPPPNNPNTRPTPTDSFLRQIFYQGLLKLDPYF
jgi:glucose/arabinose dehydrogenase